jgi:hypothetical protein
MRRRASALLLSAALGLGSTLVVAAPAHAASTVLPPQAKPVGASSGEWAARWWQWFYETPYTQSPLSSPPGTVDAPAAVDCSIGQSGHVWFLGGTFAPTSGPSSPIAQSTVYRTCSIPTGTFLFFPILNDEFDNLNCPNTDLSAEQLQDAAALGINSIVTGSMTATIDGTAVAGLEDGNSIYRAPSPWFSYTLPADNVGQLFGCDFPAGTSPPTVDGHPGATSDGIYLMVAPLSVGTHVIHVQGELNGPGVPDFIQNINYTITVAPR